MRYRKLQQFSKNKSIIKRFIFKVDQTCYSNVIYIHRMIYKLLYELEFTQFTSNDSEFLKKITNYN